MKLVRLTKMCLNGNYSRVQVSKHLSDTFIIKNVLKQGDALSPLIFNFSLDYAIKWVQANKVGLKLNGADFFLACADDLNILGGSVCTIKQILFLSYFIVRHAIYQALVTDYAKQTADWHPRAFLGVSEVK
jgi:hypothetical protein